MRIMPTVFGFQKQATEFELTQIQNCKISKERVDSSVEVEGLHDKYVEENMDRFCNNVEKLSGYVPLIGLIYNLCVLLDGGYGEYHGSEKSQRIFRGVFESLGLGIIFLPVDLIRMK